MIKMQNNCLQYIHNDVTANTSNYMLQSDKLNVSNDSECQNNYWEYSEYYLAMYLWKICPPVLELLGIVYQFSYCVDRLFGNLVVAFALPCKLTLI